MDGRATTGGRGSTFTGDGLQRSGTLMHLPALLHDFGVPLTALVAACPVPDGVWTDPYFTLPMTQICGVLAAAVRLTGCAHLGLLLGTRVDATALGLPGAWLAAAPTVGDALQGYVLLQPSNTRAAALYLLDHGSEAFFGYGIYDRFAEGREQVYALTMSIAVRMVRQMTGGRFGAAEAVFPFRAPAEPAVYARLLGAPTRFDETSCGIVLTRAALACPTAQAAGGNLDEWLRRSRDLLPGGGHSWTQRTRHIRRPLWSRSRALRDDAARLLDVAPRTLNRRLQDEGTSLRELVEEQRFIMAEELLLLTDMRVGEIALALGFEAEGSFFRSFRRWTSVTPDAWRQAHWAAV
jgi:AraC-like DNA-binding protein